jgi:hypothetical protein
MNYEVIFLEELYASKGIWSLNDKEPIFAVRDTEIRYQAKWRETVEDVVLTYLLSKSGWIDRSQQNLIHSDNTVCMLPSLMDEIYIFWVFIMKIQGQRVKNTD